MVWRFAFLTSCKTVLSPLALPFAAVVSAMSFDAIHLPGPWRPRQASIVPTLPLELFRKCCCPSRRILERSCIDATQTSPPPLSTKSIRTTLSQVEDGSSSLYHLTTYLIFPFPCPMSPSQGRPTGHARQTALRHEEGADLGRSFPTSPEPSKMGRSAKFTSLYLSSHAGDYTTNNTDDCIASNTISPPHCKHAVPILLLLPPPRRRRRLRPETRRRPRRSR